MKEELIRNLLDYLEEHLMNLSEESIRQVSDKIVHIIMEAKNREEIESLTTKGLITTRGIINTPVSRADAGAVKLPPEEQRRMDAIKENKKITAEQLAEIMDTNRNHESVYLNKLLRRGLLGRWREGKYTVYLPIEEAIRITADEMKKNNPETNLLSEENVVRICNRLGARDTAIVRQILAGM